MMPVRIEGAEISSTVNENDSSDDDVPTITRIRKSKISSESEGEECDVNIKKVTEKEVVRPKKRIILKDSSEESDDNDRATDIIPTHDGSCKPNSEILESQVTSNTDTGKSIESLMDFRQIFANKDLYDAEDSDDEPSCSATEKSNIENYDAEGSSDEEKQKVIEKKSKSRKQKTPKKSHLPSALTKKNRSKKKELKDEIDKIHSETQRIIRNSRISLPYHKPRQRTLAEFLQRRPSIPTKSLRMTTEELTLLANEVKKRAKEAEEFYKSSSEEENIVNCEERNIKNGEISENNSGKSCEPADFISISGEECLPKEKESTTTLKQPTQLCKNVDVVSCSAVPSGTALPVTETNRQSGNIECVSVGRKPGHQEQLNPVLSSLCNDTQSAMDVQNNLTTNSERNLFHYNSEHGSQDLHLRLENTETLNEVGDNMGEENCNSKAINNIGKCIDMQNELTTSDKNSAHMTVTGNPENVNEGSEGATSSSRFEERTIHFSTEKKENFPEFSCFAKPDRELLVKSNKGAKPVQIERMESNSFNIDEDIGSQDICLKFENSETLDSINNEVSVHSKNNNGVQDEAKSIARVNVPKFISESEKSNVPVNDVKGSHYIPFSDSQEARSKSQICGTDNSYSESHDSELKLSTRRNLANFFLDTKSISENTSNENIALLDKREERSDKIMEDPLLVLEGDETRVSFEQDDSALLGNKSVLHDSSNKSVANNNHISKSSGIGAEGVVADLECKDTKVLEELVKSTIKTLKQQKKIPCLKAAPGEVIDLDDTPNSKDINLFQQRFFRHSFPKAAVKMKSKDVSVVTAEKVENGEIEVKKEVITLDSEKENLVGSRSKLMDLKKELQKQIVKEREEEWNKRRLEMKEMRSQLEPDEKSDCGLFEEEEEEILETESEDEDDEDEEEEEDINYKAPRRNRSKKSAFVDDEAEISGESEMDSNEDDDDKGEDDDNDKGEDEDDSADDDNENNESNKCLIITPSDCEDNPETNDTKDSMLQTSKETHSSLKRLKTLDPFASQESNKEKEHSDCLEISQTQDDDLDMSLGVPPYQPRGAITQISDVVSQELISSGQKEESGHESLFLKRPNYSDPLGGLGIQSSLNGTDADEAELLDLCSGKFSSQPAPISQDLQDTFANDQVNSLFSNNVSTLKSLSKEDDSEDTQNSLTSELKEKTCPDDDDGDSAGIRKLTLLSDDEVQKEEENYSTKKRKKLRKRIQYSDDENDDEENDVTKTLLESEDELLKEELETPQEVEYDSEENEIPVSVSAAKDFFENEAELSESEWGSADEDEKGLDDFEEEEGDDEKLDQRAVKEQLDKIHMRQLLDEDQEDIKRLQELLLEDGEFHSDSGGRQRQFRWKNLNNTDDLALGRRSDDEVGDQGDEEEDESEWRRLRFERETFLQEHKDSLEKEILFSSADIKLKLKSDVSVPKKNGQVKRGSFLTRSETALARIALIAKSSETPVLQPKNSRNFVFATLSQNQQENEKSASKRKAVSLDNPVAKKKIKPTTSRPSLLEKIG